jgi:hypothetical protein
MAIDTETKRRSVHGYTLNAIGPVPDGTIGTPDRPHTAWLYSGLTYESPVVGTLGGHFWPPNAEDPRVVAFFLQQNITPTRGIDYEMRWALAKDMSLNEAQALTVQVDDMWMLYKAVNGITDDSAPFFFPL